MVKSASSDPAMAGLVHDLAAADLKQPLHAKVRDVLRERILKGFGHDERFYSESELIQGLKVSKPTIRRALSELVSENLLKPAWRRGFFVQKLALPRYVGLIDISSVSNDSVPTETAEAFSVACEEKFILNVYYAHKGESVDSLFNTIRQKPALEKLVIIGLTTEYTLELDAKLQANGYEHVVIGPRVKGLTGSSLSFDHAFQVDQVLDHLTGLGHERIAFIVNEPRVLFLTSHRAETVQRKLEERNLTQSALIFCDTPLNADSFEAAYRKTGEIWTSSSPRPTAIVPLSGVGAWAVLRYAMDHGIRVPEDLSILSFDPVVQFPISGGTAFGAAVFPGQPGGEGDRDFMGRREEAGDRCLSHRARPARQHRSGQKVIFRQAPGRCSRPRRDSRAASRAAARVVRPKKIERAVGSFQM